MSKIAAFTDGSSRGNPGRGGYGVIILDFVKGWVEESGGYKSSTTNNEMELTAVLMVLRYVANLSEARNITIYSDSSYVIQGATSWVHGWKKRGWLTSTGEGVANLTLWQELYALQARVSVEYVHVRGHVGITGNERCDKIATSYADTADCSCYVGALDHYTLGARIVDEIENKFVSGESTQSTIKKKSTPKGGWYISLVDGIFMRHETWDECKLRVHGNSAKFKKVATMQEEEQYKKSWGL